MQALSIFKFISPALHVKLNFGKSLQDLMLITTSFTGGY
jgi:hypothetical protein